MCKYRNPLVCLRCGASEPISFMTWLWKTQSKKKIAWKMNEKKYNFALRIIILVHAFKKWGNFSRHFRIAHHAHWRSYQIIPKVWFHYYFCSAFIPVPFNAPWHGSTVCHSCNLPFDDVNAFTLIFSTCLVCSLESNSFCVTALNLQWVAADLAHTNAVH